MHHRVAALAALVLALADLTPAAAQRCFAVYVHGRNADNTNKSQTELESHYWSPNGRDSATHWGAGRQGCTILRAGYNGGRAFYDAGAVNTVAQQINTFFANNAVTAADDVTIFTHSMGGLVSRYLVNNGVPNSIRYNQGSMGGAREGKMDIPNNDSSTWYYYNFTIPQSGTVSGNVYAWVDIEHSWKGDLEVEIGHEGRWVRVHNRTGGDSNDIKQNFVLGNFAGLPAGGTWQMRVRDLDSSFWVADSGHVNMFSVHADTTERGSSCSVASGTRHRHCDFRNIASLTDRLITYQAPHTGVKAADALSGEADWYSNTSADLIQFLGMETNDRAAQAMRRSFLHYASASGSWMGDAARYVPMYTVTSTYADSSSGVGDEEDGLLNVAWGGICYHSHAVNLWLCGRTPGDGLVEELAGRAQFQLSGSGYGESGMPQSGVWRSWSSSQYVQGARSMWLRYDGNHHSGRHDGHNDDVYDYRAGTSTTSWPYYYASSRFRQLPSNL